MTAAGHLHLLVEELARAAAPDAGTLSVETAPDLASALAPCPFPATVAQVALGQDGSALLTLTAESKGAEARARGVAAAAAAALRARPGGADAATPALSVAASADDVSVPVATTVLTVSLAGEVPCLLVVAVSDAVAVLLTGGTLVSGETLRDLPLHFWAELGRARVPLAQAVSLPPGSVLELDRGVDDPVDLYVNGRHCGLGRLVLTEEGDWAVEVVEIADSGDASEDVPA